MSLLKLPVEVIQYIEYTYMPHSPETYTDPEVEAEIEVESVMVNGVDILPSMSRGAIDRLEELCMEDYNDE